MRRRARSKVWTFILLFLLCGGGTVTMPRGVQADLTPDTTELPPPPTPGAGDPDFPDGTARTPKPGASRGFHRQSPRDPMSVRKDRMGNWVWNFRMVFVAGLRVYFRF